MALSIQTGSKVSVNGLFLCGAYPGIKNFKSNICEQLVPGEKVICDRWYTARECVNRVQGGEGLSSALLACHETLNGKLKNFNLLSTTLRCNVRINSPFLHGIVNLTQKMMEDGEGLFNVI